MMLDYILSKNSTYKFISFKSGNECLQNLYLNPEVIILDYEMPGLNGYETLLEIKKQNPNIHVVFLTSKEEPQLQEKLLAAGADDYVLKQGQGETKLIEKIENILKNRSGEPVKQSGFKNKVLYLILIAILLIIGICYYNV